MLSFPIVSQNEGERDLPFRFLKTDSGDHVDRLGPHGPQVSPSGNYAEAGRLVGRRRRSINVAEPRGHGCPVPRQSADVPWWSPPRGGRWSDEPFGARGPAS